MRVIKFRARLLKDKFPKSYNKGYVYGFVSKSQDGKWFMDTSGNEGDFIKNGSYVEVEPETIGEFIGITNEKCQEIYEGDVIEFDDMGEEGYEYMEAYDFANRAVVVFENGRFELSNFSTNNSTVLADMNGEDHETFVAVFKNSRVLGDIHQNPELLKVGSRR